MTELQKAAERWRTHVKRIGYLSSPYWITIESDQDYEGWDVEQRKHDAELLATAYVSLPDPATEGGT